MIPKLVKLAHSPFAVLPPGIHEATLQEIYNAYAINTIRGAQFDGLSRGLGNIFAAGCRQAFLDGSYVTEKPNPGDYEVCWDVAFVDWTLLDPVLLTFDAGRRTQKVKYLGEYFPAQATADQFGTPYLDFFQHDKFSGEPKGIIRISNI